jgi:hypothetical protein
MGLENPNRVSTTDLWQAVYAAFPYPSDRVQSEINRIASKCLKKALGWTQPVVLDASTGDVREELIHAKDLPGLICHHSRTNVTNRTTPIVIVQASGTLIVIEGNNRVNKWVNEGNLNPCRALIIALRQSAPTA